MSLDTPNASNDLLNLIIYDAHFASSNYLVEADVKPHEFLHHHHADTNNYSSSVPMQNQFQIRKQNLKKRKRRKPISKSKEEAESHRITHIAVERNRRKQINHHLSVLRSLMPPSYVQRGDQASVVGGAIEFVKEVEQLLQSLEAQKLQLQKGTLGSECKNEDGDKMLSRSPPFSQFFKCPWFQIPHKYSTKDKAAIADIEVTLIETHANLRVLSIKTPSLLTNLVSGFHSLFLTILHINVTSMDPLVLFSISAQLEEQCRLTSVDDIAAAVHHMLTIIDEGVGLA